MKYKMDSQFKSQFTAVIVALGVLTPYTCFASANADDPGESERFTQIPFLKDGSPIDQLRKAIDSVENEPMIRELLGTEKQNALTVTQLVSGADIETTKFQHYFNGLEVYGSLAFHHKSAKGTEIRDSLKRFDLDIRPTLDVNNVVSLAKSVAGDRDLIEAPELKIFPSESGDSAQLVYWVKLAESGPDGGRELIIDAHTGQVIGDLSTHMELAPILVYSAKNRGLEVQPLSDGTSLKGCNVKDLATGKTRKVDGATCNKLGAGLCQVVVDGSPVMVNPSSCLKTFPAMVLKLRISSEESSDRAAKNSQAVVGYYLNTLGRNSYDGSGSSVISVVHGGEAYMNAHWDTEAKHMVYGDGDGKTLGDFTLALDVAGHEMTHGVTAATAKLLGMGESGALNEAYSDFFGKMIDNNGDWAIGRKLFVDQKNAKGVRDLANPHAISVKLRDGTSKPLPDKISEKLVATGACDGTNDRCYVHLNATIPGHASYLVVKAIGQPKAEKLYYTVLTQALGPRDDITTAATTTKKTCKQMYDSATCDLVAKAFAQVGL